MPTQPTTPKKLTLTERYAALQQDMEVLQGEHGRIVEYMSSAMRELQREDAQWASSMDGVDYRGLDLATLKKWSNEIRASLTGSTDGRKAPNPHMRNGLMLRHSFVWDGDIHYDGFPKAERGPTAKIKPIIEGRVDNGDARSNESYRMVFAPTARRKREHALFSDALYLVIGDNKKKTVRPVPLHEITDTHRDANYEDEIVAYRITRKKSVQDGVVRTIADGERHDDSEWVYVDWYGGTIPDRIVYQSKPEPVKRGFTAFDLHANRPDGAAFGSPDAIAAVVWARIIRDLIMNGVKMQDALAMFAFKAVAPGPNGQKGAALELAKASEAGSTATLGGETDFVPLNTAGKGYDFASIGFVVSTMAASLHVPGISLSANTALAGSSYGAAKTLDLPGRLAMETRRREHIEFDERILRWMGAPNATAYFNNYDDATDEYRSVQAAYLLWQSGRIGPEQFGDMIDSIYGHKVVGDIPNGILTPNNKKTANAGSAPTTGAPGQGQSDGTGGKDHVGDIPAKAK